MSSVTVFCGSDEHPDLAKDFYKAGQVLARHFDLVRFGGGLKRGTMMGELAAGVLDVGGKLEGIISADYWPEQPAFPEGMTATRVETEIERNEQNLSSDEIIAGPGQAGTLYEAIATLAYNRARVKKGGEEKPFHFLNLNGYFNDLNNFLQNSFRVFGEPEVDRSRYYNICDGLNALEAMYPAR